MKENPYKYYILYIIGLEKVRSELLHLKIPFHLFFGEAKTSIPAFVKKNKIGGVVTDFAPLRVPRKWVDEVASALPDNVPLCQVCTF